MVVKHARTLCIGIAIHARVPVGRGGGGVLPHISYIGVCGAKGYGF